MKKSFVYFVLVWVLLGLGLIFSFILSHNYFASFIVDSKTIDLFCVEGSYFDCQKVSQGEYSSVFGFPVALMGFGFFIMAAFYYFLPYLNRDKINYLTVPFFGILIIANVFDLVLLYLSLMVIGKLCLQCVVLYFVSASLLVLFYFYEWVVLDMKNRWKGFGSLLKNNVMVQKELTIFLLIAFLIFGILSFWSSNQKLHARMTMINLHKDYMKTASTKFQEQYYKRSYLKIDISDAPVFGNTNAPIELVIFHDLQCFHCQKSFHSLKKLLGEYGDLVKLVYMNYPIIGANQQSEIDSTRLAAYSLVAHKEGFYRDFLVRLFAFFKKGTYVDLKVIRKIFSAIGVKANFNIIEQKANDLMNKVKAEYELAERLYKKSGQTRFGTPGMFLNKRFVNIGYNEPLLKKLLDQEVLRVAKKRKIQ